MFRLIALAAALLACALSAAGQSPVQPGLYKLEPKQARVRFEVTRLGLITYQGEFIGASGTLIFNPVDVGASRLEVSVPMSGVATPNRWFSTELSGPSWFGSARFPVMTFHSTAVAPTGPDTADVTGDLSLHGVTRAVTLKVTFNGATGAPKSRAYAGFEARGRIRRSDFGVGRYAFMIGDNVNLIISATFERASP